MTSPNTLSGAALDLGFEASLDEALRRCVAGYLKRRRLSARRFGAAALGDPGFIGCRLKRGRTVHLYTADRILSFMGERPFSPMFRGEVEAFIAVTGTKASVLGQRATGNPSFVSRLRRGASPRLATVDRVRDWMVRQASARQQRAIRSTVAKREPLRVGIDGQADLVLSSGPQGERSMSKQPEYLSPPEAAEVLGMSVRTLARYRVNGVGPPFHKLCGCVRYVREDLNDWAAARRRLSTSDDGGDEPRTGR